MSAEHEIIGRQQVELENLNREYDNLLIALEAVATGQIELSRVKVDKANRSWQILPATSGGQ
jgi:hypothetical protein